MQKKYIFFIIIIFLSQLSAKLNLRSKTSFLELDSEARFVLENQVSNFNGKLVSENDESLEGEKIIFNQGVLKKKGAESVIDGELDPSLAQNSITLTGNKTLRGSGSGIINKITINGQDNRLEGEIILDGPIVLQDSVTTATLALLRRLTQNVELNGGKIFLEEDLDFIDGKRIIGPGIVEVNKRKLKFGAEPLSLSETVTFLGANDIDLQGNLTVTTTLFFGGEQVNTINGNGNIIFIEPTGALAIQTLSNLTLKNVKIQGVRGENIYCVDDFADLTLQKVDWVQNGNFYFKFGFIDFIDFVNFFGPFSFNYQAILQSTIQSYSRLSLRDGMRFSYAPESSSQNLLQLAHSSSEFELKGATLHISTTGMQLSSGVLKVKEKNILESDSLTKNAGFIVGDGILSDNNLQIELFPEATLDVTKGYIVYRNVDEE